MRPKGSRWGAGVLAAGALVILAACSPAAIPANLPSPPSEALSTPGEPTLTPFEPLPTPGQTPRALETGPPPTPDIRSAGLQVWVSPDLPEALRAALALPSALAGAQRAEEADLQLAVGDEPLFGRWVYALVAPFPSLAEGVTAGELRRAWRGEGSAGDIPVPLLMDAATRQVFTAFWGAPGPRSIEVRPARQLVDRAWDNRPAWALVPFEALDPRWKVLPVNGQSPIDKEFDLAAYPLSVPLTLEGEPRLVEALATLFGPDSGSPLLPASNRDPDKLTVLVLTGVTALVRSTAWTLERQGLTYPARDIGPWLRQADITHISNEVPFAYDCPFPDPVQEDLVFCSDPRYIELLEEVGTDIVELTGDHFQDWGSQAMLDTLDLYRQRGWPYYGGGENLAEGRRPVVLEHNGNRVGFLGCNGKGGYYASATDTRPGAVGCDFDYLAEEIGRLRAEGVLPVVTFQHFEYYTYAAPPNQLADFRRVAEAGAVIVSGSQGHHPQIMEFYEDAFIHYGLGNLFFDQIYVSPETARAFIDRYAIYDGRLVSIELLTTQFEDYARSRPMTAEERAQFLQTVFTASGW